MIKNSSKDFKRKFLLAFTNQLIRAHTPRYFLDQQIKGRIKEVDQEKQSQETKFKTLKELKKEVPELFNKPYFKRTQEIRETPMKILRIPEPKLPPHLQYLRPTAKSDVKINLGKLNPLLADPQVKSIECNGENQKVIVRIPQPKPANIQLTKEEIDNIIDKFEQESKIPADEGFYRVAVGALVFSAIISDLTGSRFLIKKIPQQKQMPQRRMQEFRPMMRR